MVVLGLDPGLNECGVAIVENGKIIDAQLISNPSKEKGLGKLQDMIQLLGEYIIDKQDIIDKVYIEFTYAFSGGSLHNMCKLGAVSGSATSFFHRDQVKLVASSEWKVKQKKAENHKYMLERLSKANLERLENFLKPIPNGKRHNVLDAVGIAMYGYNQEKKQ